MRVGTSVSAAFCCKQAATLSRPKLHRFNPPSPPSTAQEVLPPTVSLPALVSLPSMISAPSPCAAQRRESKTTTVKMVSGFAKFLDVLSHCTRIRGHRLGRHIFKSPEVKFRSLEHFGAKWHPLLKSGSLNDPTKNSLMNTCPLACRKAAHLQLNAGRGIVALASRAPAALGHGVYGFMHRVGACNRVFALVPSLVRLSPKTQLPRLPSGHGQVRP